MSTASKSDNMSETTASSSQSASVGASSAAETSKQPPAKEAAATAAAAAPKLKGSDIATILQSKGPVVKAVLLRHMRPDGKDTKPHAHVEEEDPNKVSPENHRPVLEELVEEIEIDTTPSRNHVKDILGGPFTFLGQWPTEGTVLMARQDFTSDLPEKLGALSIGKLRNVCRALDIDTSQMIEKPELVSALEEARSKALPLNPHFLQPPLHNLSHTARGDIVVLKVAETKEELDHDSGGEDEKDEPDKLEMMSNEEFFLNYSREEYLRFASRTDIPMQDEHVKEEAEEEEREDADQEGEDDQDEAEGDDGDDEDDDYQLECDGEMDKTTLLNIVLGGVIQKFREENGRGPNTEELLELRGAVAAELEVEVPAAPSADSGKEAATRKRPATDPDGSPSKRVKFHVEESDDKNIEIDSKPQAEAPATPANNTANLKPPPAAVTPVAAVDEEVKEEKTD